MARPSRARRADVAGLVTLAATGAIALSSTCAAAAVVDCPLALVRAYTVEFETDVDAAWRAEIRTAEPGIFASGSPADRRVVVTGPVFGSMDSRELETTFACTADGLAVTFVVTRSAQYRGGVKKNVLWRPRVVLALLERGQIPVVAAIWRMRDDRGQELERADTPPLASYALPLTVRKRLE